MTTEEAKELVRKYPEIKNSVIGSDGTIVQHPDPEQAKKDIEEAGNEVVYPDDLITHSNN